MKYLLDEAVAIAMLSELQAAISARELTSNLEYVDLDSKLGHEVAIQIVLKHFHRIRQDWRKSEQEERSRDTLRETIARAYCHPKNANKVLDSDLLEAIIEELTGEQIIQPYTDFRGTESLI